MKKAFRAVVVFAIILGIMVSGSAVSAKVFTGMQEVSTAITEKTYGAVQSKVIDRIREDYRVDYAEPTPFIITGKQRDDVNFFGEKQEVYVLEIWEVQDDEMVNKRKIRVPEEIYQSQRVANKFYLYDDSERMLYDHNGQVALLKVLP